MPIDPAIVRSYLAHMSAVKIPKRDQQRLAKLLTYCESFPEIDVAAVGERHLALTIRGKTFAYYLHDHHGDGIVCICCKSTLARQKELVARDPRRYCVPAYLGPRGWVSLRLDGDRIDWSEAADLLLDAWRRQAPRRLASEME